MYVKVLKLKNFRNYENLTMEFSPGINFITGENGAGKTNILEGITITSSVRSFRNIHDREIIRWGHDSYFCSSEVADGPDRTYEVGCLAGADKVTKRLKINGAAARSMSDYFGRMLTVVFSPADIDIISGPPETRRRYFDSVISKMDRQYLVVLTEFLVYSSAGENHSEENIDRALKRIRHRDIAAGSTGTGPHRDDYLFVNEQRIGFSSYGSQGQKRTAVISLKLAECAIVEEKTGNRAIVLVDDIFSELDVKRRGNMIDILFRENQVIFTMANAVIPDTGGLGPCSTFQVVNNSIVSN